MTAAGPASLAAELDRGAEALCLALSETQRVQLLQHLALIERWSRVYNLTAVQGAEAMLVQHLLDSLAVVGPLRRQTGGSAAAVLDVGSGAGLPGVVLAVTCPELTVTCVDAVGKKASFLRQVGVELGLRNLQGVHARVEQLTRKPWQVVTARAFASLADFVALTRPLLAPEGVWMALKGQTPTDELAGLPSTVETFHVEQLRVPGLAAQRCIVWMRPLDKVS